MAVPIFSQELYLAAATFAAGAHGDQKVPGSGHPYLLHLTSVAMEVLAALQADGVGDPDLAVQCALLHDSMEDAGVTRQALEERFGARVAEGVAALTKDEALPKAERMADSLARIGRLGREVAWVKLADRITNLQPPPAHWPPEKRQAYRAEAQQILDALGASSPYLAARLRQKIASYAAFC